jgi:homotetrameric cytidine deaminase
MSQPDETQVLAAARQARTRAHAPYSQFRVGAAIVTGSGRIVQGCNVENVSYGATVCAERTAIWTAVATHGEKDITLVAVVAEGKKPIPPCALCLQVMAEFLKPSTPIILADETQVLQRTTFGELLPQPFGPGSFDPPKRDDPRC